MPDEFDRLRAGVVSGCPRCGEKVIGDRWFKVEVFEGLDGPLGKYTAFVSRDVYHTDCWKAMWAAAVAEALGT